jgi:hypothetical protein
MLKVVEVTMCFTLTLFPFNITSNARFLLDSAYGCTQRCQLRANRYRLREFRFRVCCHPVDRDRPICPDCHIKKKSGVQAAW